MKVKEVKLESANILLICTTDNMIWQFLLPHIEDLKKYGAKVDCVCSKTGFWFDELKNQFGLNMIEVPMERSPLKLKNLKAYNQVKKLQKENNYNLVYCQQPVGGLIGRFIGKKFKIPVIYTAHGFFFFKGNNKIKNFIFRSAEKYMSKYTTALITMNDEDYNACKKWKCKTYKINGIGFDELKYEESEFDKNAFKRELGILENEKVILSVSEFIKRKNYKSMLKTFSEICKTRSDVKYLLCGTGVLLNEMKAYAQELNISDKTIFLGYRKDINKIMQISDIFFHESFHEGLTMSIMEAMNYSLPVVTSNARGNIDLIENEKGGIITQCEDIASQVKALNLLLDNNNLRHEMGEYNKQNVKKYYLDFVREQLKGVYKTINLF